MRCLSITSESTLVVTSAVECESTDYVLLTLAEHQEATASPFRLTATEGGLLSVAILTVWAAAFTARAAIKALNGGDPET